MKRLLILVLAAIAGLPASAAAAGTCSNERPREVMAELEVIDDAGEKELNMRLQALSKQEGWSQNEWQTYVLSLADSPEAAAREERRDALFVELFQTLSGPPPFDCERLDALEAEIIALEKQQWQESIAAVEARLNNAPAADYL